jgi:hypothetical protein
MTPRSLFTIVLKIIGILFIKDILDAIPQFILSIVEFLQFDSSMQNIWAPIFIILSCAVYVCAAYYFIFKTNDVINKLNLDKDFSEENFPLNIHRSTVLSIVIIIIGGLLIADNIPLLCRSIYLYFQTKSIGDAFTKSPDFSYIIIYALKILVGLILTGNHQLFVNYIERKRKPVIISNETEIKE